MSSQTLGQARVGLSFNPSGDPDVSEAKERAAGLIDYAQEFAEQARQEADMHLISGSLAGEKRRLVALSQTAAEEAAMWLVKAITKEEPA